MNTHFKKIQDGFYCYPKFGDNKESLDPDDGRITLALFNFFGTLVWGENGTLINYEKLSLSSPFCKENLKNIQDKKYIVCVLEYIPENKIDKFLNAVEIFYLSVMNKVTIHFFIYTDKNYTFIKEGLIKYFAPEKGIFGKKSFYCGDNVGKDSSFPWYRYSDSDSELAKKLEFKFYEPIQILGCFHEKEYVPNTLYITCGQKYSGFEMEYESFRKEKIIQGIVFRVLETEKGEVYGILTEDLFKDLLRFPTKRINFEKNMTIIVFGQNPTHMEREILRNKFINYSFAITRWYGRPNYKMIEDKTFSKYFENPLLYGEMFTRAN